MPVCNVCGGDTAPITVKEQMIGLNEDFLYHQCTKCGHTYLGEIPINIAKYYKEEKYYSFREQKTSLGLLLKKIKNLGTKKAVQLKIKDSFLLSPSLNALLTINGINTSSKILDFGCGIGKFVHELKDAGFTAAVGYDLFLKQNFQDNGETYLTNDLNDFGKSQWNIITLNHVFEHLQSPLEVLTELQKKLLPGGKIILRIPVIDSMAYEKYKENWVQFDAPRHINLFTRKSIKLAIEKDTNFKIVNMYDDSSHFQFTGSNLYLEKKTLQPGDNNFYKRLTSIKTYYYYYLSKKLNRQNRGDQVTVVLELTP